MEKFTQSFQFLLNKKLFAKIFFYSLLVWMVTFLSYYVIFKSLNINIPLYAYFFIISVSAIGMVIPSSPANIGVYHAIATGAIMLFMVNKDTAFTIAVIANAFDVLPSIIFGAFILLRKNIALLGFYRKEARVAAKPLPKRLWLIAKECYILVELKILTMKMMKKKKIAIEIFLAIWIAVCLSVWLTVGGGLQFERMMLDSNKITSKVHLTKVNQWLSSNPWFKLNIWRTHK